MFRNLFFLIHYQFLLLIIIFLLKDRTRYTWILNLGIICIIFIILIINIILSWQRIFSLNTLSMLRLMCLSWHSSCSLTFLYKGLLAFFIMFFFLYFILNFLFLLLLFFFFFLKHWLWFWIFLLMLLLLLLFYVIYILVLI